MIGMKAITSIEFILAAFVFVTTIFFILSSIINSIPVLHRESVSDSARADVYQVSQILIFSKGEDGWETRDIDNTTMIGLSSDKKYVLYTQKIRKLNYSCIAAYENISRILGPVAINITDISGRNLLDCKPTGFNPLFTIERFSSLDDKRIVKIMVSME